MPLRMGTPLPELTGATEWINGEVTREQLLGSPVLVHFFAKSCPICHDNMPTVAEWRDRYADLGLKVVAIHMPREQSDTDLEAVRADIEALGIKEPCAIDNLHAIGERFENQLWPAYYVFDAEGVMRGRAGGYAGLRMIEPILKRVLGVEEATV
ncbi:thiol-disulfide isomerase-like thioredoxin [Chthonomonas calidirosea]|uniref:Thiol-disulfide isomerase and thioredoxins n=1 Tax=Chthonomonas calidirosea (strain DSM 23976 / ICMP 18418 / T49) TaxID=1303518 RepID=S0EX35_CHTCT|nr:redoxin domain-containing protein [Chthonomonas calidirosea]CCW34856.1 Thiol-disulfide isomerase and thioredoxins [Chthonomonas calidirosea T49]CEK12628.1 thiol-disulfide isomerase-like thioredoxin [Chthonomonas calidirosea]CEK12629.1 thiol-disulfide isomerase-like thioredoxin [Chthonomonas calidirosea]CEK13599.1 thiol-disulfide isomerase-like thioredoxin [Chthonomonas calidirosea]